MFIYTSEEAWGMEEGNSSIAAMRGKKMRIKKRCMFG